MDSGPVLWPRFGLCRFVRAVKKFINVLTQTRKLDLPCKLVAPAELLRGCKFAFPKSTKLLMLGQSY